MPPTIEGVEIVYGYDERRSRGRQFFGETIGGQVMRGRRWDVIRQTRKEMAQADSVHHTRGGLKHPNAHRDVSIGKLGTPKAQHWELISPAHFEEKR
jgi:hypothetical protein